MADLNEQQIRSLVQDEIRKTNGANRFQLSSIPRHIHNGTDSPKITQSNVLLGFRAEGRITFAQQTQYRIGITFNPTAIYLQGNVIGNAGERFIIVGNAQLGASFYMQPGTTTSVITGGPVQSLIQSTTYFGVDSGGAFHTVADEGHIVDVEYPLATVHARATITKFDSTAVYVQVDTLAAGWTMNLSWTIV